MGTELAAEVRADGAAKVHFVQCNLKRLFDFFLVSIFTRNFRISKGGSLYKTCIGMYLLRKRVQNHGPVTVL